MTGAARSRGLRLAAGSGIIAGTVALLTLLLTAGEAIARSADEVRGLAHAMTGVGTAHREVMKMQLAAVRGGPDAVETVRLRRALMGQNLRLARPGMTDRARPNPSLPEFDAALTRVDALLDDHEPSLEELQPALADLELTGKHLYDDEQFHYATLTGDVVAAKLQSHRTLIVLGVSITAVATVLFVNVQRSAKSRLRAKAAELQRALEELGAAQADRDRLLDGIVQVGERERTRLAAELHDGPIQALTAVGLKLDRGETRLGRGDVTTATGLFDAARLELDGEIHRLRRLMWELRPPALDERGLAAALHDYIRAYSAEAAISVIAEIDCVEDLDRDVETVLYRIAQEALTNVSRHSGADSARISVKHSEGGAVVLTIEDSGRGFDPADCNDFVRNSHFGLAGMRERVAMVGGQLRVDSAPSKGTRLTAALPAVASDRIQSWVDARAS